ncbi:2-dehydropantoate 2-reductase [Bacterioplanes sanyensis]|uniref:2-dehydropantoate 2-reductase n=1 Tax=Bacterioplanes sanyensis TaxID=1249553 RepID=A0A222FM15_9GAMM|nr:2-dehydropantoate 2-reductase [Bacterioplanes sanyensis]ASP39431.1 2-dehydropantoate 2-reductase [Bacterioplanes sanyensis]
MITIGILGLGAMGTLMAYHWRQHRVFALTQQPQLSRTLQLPSPQQAKPSAVSLQLPCWQQQPLDWLVVCTKAADTLTALTPYRQQLSSVRRLVLLQNGVGQQQQVQQWLDGINAAPTLWVASSTEGAYRLAQDTVVYAGQGTTVAGPWLSQADQAPLPPGWQFEPNMRERLLHKLALNAVINPLTAKHRCRNGELLSQQYWPETEALCDEVEQAFEQLQWPCPTPLVQRVREVATATANNQSSTLQDILANRANELPHITGYILQAAAAQQLALPQQRALAQQLNIRW